MKCCSNFLYIANELNLSIMSLVIKSYLLVDTTNRNVVYRFEKYVINCLNIDLIKEML